MRGTPTTLAKRARRLAVDSYGQISGRLDAFKQALVAGFPSRQKRRSRRGAGSDLTEAPFGKLALEGAAAALETAELADAPLRSKTAPRDASLPPYLLRRRRMIR